MVKDNYRIVIPYTQNKDIELTARFHEKKNELCVHDRQPELLNNATTDKTILLDTSKQMLRDRIPTNVLRVLKTTYRALSSVLACECTFLVATATGFQVVRINEILYFEYSKPKKLWILVLANLSTLILKRNTVATDILEYSPSFVRINQHQIINIEYLTTIEGRTCKLSNQQTHDSELVISRSFLKNLQTCCRMI